MALGKSEAGRYLAVIFIHKKNNYALILSARDMAKKGANNMKGNKSKTLPPFGSVDELVAFFERQDMGDYWEHLPEAELEVSLRKRRAATSTSSSTNNRSESRSNTGKPWTSTQVKQLRQLARQNTPTRLIGLKLGRTESAVRTKASEKGVSLKSKNQSPYYRRRK